MPVILLRLVLGRSLVAECPAKLRQSRPYIVQSGVKNMTVATGNEQAGMPQEIPYPGHALARLR